MLKFTSLLENMTKDTDEQPDEKIYKVRTGKVPSARASVPTQLACVGAITNQETNQLFWFKSFY